MGTDMTKKNKKERLNSKRVCKMRNKADQQRKLCIVLEAGKQIT